MSRLPWSFDWNDIRAVAGSNHISFATTSLSSYDLVEINRGMIKRTATRAVLSAGTGLGAAGLFWTGSRWLSASGASRFASFPSPLGHEFDIRSAIAHEGFVYAGQILTGRGLVALYEALA